MSARYSARLYSPYDHALHNLQWRDPKELRPKCDFKVTSATTLPNQIKDFSEWKGMLQSRPLSLYAAQRFWCGSKTSSMLVTKFRYWLCRNTSCTYAVPLMVRLLGTADSP